MKYQIAKLNAAIFTSFTLLRTKLRSVLTDTKGTGSFDTVMGVLISVVLGALLLTALYALFKSNVLPGLADQIKSIFNFEG